MNNKKSFNFYKAYSLWKETLSSDRNYQAYINSLNVPSSGNSVLNGVVGNKIMDLEWVKKVEEALPYMDKAIRMNRSFIEQKDEIVPVEKVKRVNTQSVRHLAQHTNLIAKVEKNGDVLPDRILNIYYESSFAIYENRFLFSLLGKLLDFVEKKYQALKNLDEKVEVVYTIDKTVRRKSKISKMNLQFEYNTNATTKFSLDDNPSELSGFARVLRIRSIIQDFYTTTLIKDLASLKVEPVRPPIINTNLMAKNVNFRTCKELWEYIDMYRGPGYFYEDKKFTGKMPDKIKSNLQDVFVFANFLNEITFNSEFSSSLEKSLKQEKRELEKAKRLQEKNSIEKVLKQNKKEFSEVLAKKLSAKERVYEIKLSKKEKFLNARIESLKKQKQLLEDKYTRIKNKIQKDKQKQVQTKLIEELQKTQKIEEKAQKNEKKVLNTHKKQKTSSNIEKTATVVEGVVSKKKVASANKNAKNERTISKQRTIKPKDKTEELIKKIKKTIAENEKKIDLIINQEENKKAN